MVYTHVVAIMDYVAINMRAQVFVWTYIFLFICSNNSGFCAYLILFIYLVSSSISFFNIFLFLKFFITPMNLSHL